MLKSKVCKVMQTAKQKIMVIIGSMDVGGTETHLTRSLPFLNKDKRTIRVVCFRHGGALARVLEENGVEVCFPHPLRKPTKFWSFTRFVSIVTSVNFLIKELRRFKPDVAHYFLPEAYILGGFLSLIFGPRRRVMSRRSRNFYQQRSPLTRLELFLHGRMDWILTNSKANLVDLKEEGAPMDRTILCYNGIDAAPYKLTQSQRNEFSCFGIEEDDYVITCVANLIPYKGHSDIIAALKIVRDRACKETLKPPKMLFVGRDGGIEPELDRQATAAGVRELLTFAGARADVGRILSISDMAILASHEEGMSNALLEYMCCSLPIVATNVGGNQETIGDAGWLVPPHSPEDLAKAIFEIYLDQGMAEMLGRKARKRVCEHFPLSESIRIYGSIYDSL